MPARRRRCRVGRRFASVPVRESSAPVAVGALLDVDGTLVDTNYQHALSWFRSFRDHDIVLPVWRLHRHIGMGADQLIPAVAGERVARELGEELRAGDKRHFHAMIDECELMPDARRLIEVLHDRGGEIVLASSASEEDLAHYRAMLAADDLIDAATSSADVEQTKPEPDLILAAMGKLRRVQRAVMVGDSTWDCEAALRAGIPSVALLTGGFAEAELREAGAAAVFESIAELIDAVDDTPLGG
jgi:HAD superfamily hydrolase (TIGR01509 family)